MDSTSTHCDVLIVGLGPTGAMLANLLGQQGWSVVGLERDEDVYYAPRAVHFDDEIMRIFQAAGLAEEIARTSEAFTDMEIILKPGGKPAMRTKIGSQDARYGHPGAWWFHQPTLEKHLRDGLKRFANVEAVYGASVTAVGQDHECATATAQLEDGSVRQFRARYLIGCDGGRSFVRREAGLQLDSADFDEAWVVIDTKTISGQKDPTLPPNHRQCCNPVQPVTYVPMAGPYYEWQFMVMGGKSEREATDPVFVRRQLADFVDLKKVEITRIAYYKFHALWAREWRNERIVLAGDSAHQMPPFLGQGMCSGIRDAHSLSWRLDLVLRGDAPVKLLDDYQTERGAHVRHIINGAMLLGHVIQTRNRLVALLRNYLLFLPSRLIPAINRFAYEMSNRKRPLKEGYLGRNRRALAGRLFIQPRIERLDGRMVLLDEALGNGFALLVHGDALQNQQPAVKRLTDKLPLKVVSFHAHASRDHVGDRDGKLRQWFNAQGVDFVLIRPDRYVYDAGRAADLDAVASQALAACTAAEHASARGWAVAA